MEESYYRYVCSYATNYWLNSKILGGIMTKDEKQAIQELEAKLWKVWFSEKLKYGENAHRVEIAISEWYGVYLVMQKLDIESISD